jgi:oxysterol-binding protein 1
MFCCSFVGRYRSPKALRANDKAGVNDALKSYISSFKRPSLEKNRQATTSGNEIATPLHLAVQCAPTAMVEYIISKGIVDLRAKYKHGNTALHFAAMQGREDVVELLLREPDVDDTATNNQGKQVSFSPDRYSHDIAL